MKEKQIILRNPRSQTRDVFTGGAPEFGARDFGVAPIEIAVEEMTRGEIRSAAREADVVAIAPSMPMCLIKPLDADGSTGTSSDSVTWGVQAVGADTSPFTGDGVVIAVLDTGIDPVHPAFAGVELIRRNFTAEGDDDQDGHGTHCAGTIFGRDVDGLRIGVAPGVQRALIGKVLGDGGGSSDQIVRAMQWAIDEGAHVISMSLGIDFPRFVRLLVESGLPLEAATTRALEGYRANVQLFERMAALIRSRALFSQSTLVIAAAGNESRRASTPSFEIAVAPPAVAEGVISVAAIGEGQQGFEVASFSNTFANVSGPGVNVLSARAGGGLLALNGTSMATPHVAGTAALWAEKISQLAPLNGVEWTSRLVGSATRSGLATGIDPTDVGAGLVQAPQS